MRIFLGVAALALLGGCALFRPVMVESGADTGPVTVSGTTSSEAIYLVEPQITVLSDGPSLSTRAGGSRYAMWCADCHGATGDGNGRVAGMMTERPSDLTALARGNGGRFPAAQVMNRLTMAPGPYHRGIAADLAVALDGPMVEWAAPDGRSHMTTSGMAEMLSYVQSMQQ
ncbi:hypothetical protein [Sagittula sp. S175]|uniref:hypothetical protein n=1 Tax=Sagittula sp. S175 TaxID=3415129 RepID=UPI003C7A556B